MYQISCSHSVQLISFEGETSTQHLMDFLSTNIYLFENLFHEKFRETNKRRKTLFLQRLLSINYQELCDLII